MQELIKEKVKYPNVRKLKLRHEDLAKIFGFKTTATFRSSSAHKRYMKAADELIGFVFQNIKNTI